MAKSVAYAFLKPLLDQLGSSIVTEFGLLWGVKEELDKLSSFMSAIQSVLQDAEEKQIHSKQVRDWITKLKDVIYDAEDILDDFATEALRSKVEGENQTSKWKQVYNFFLSCFGLKSLRFRYEISHRIKDINEKLERIAKERNDLHLHEGGGGSQLPEVGKRSKTISLIHESDVLGRENDKEKLINLLVSDGSVAKELSVIPIVGMGGVGKTTLAQLIYNDESVEKHFEIRGWVCVSDDFDLERLSKAIIESTSKTSSNYKELTSLTEEIKKIVSGKKFLLVLDDVWNEDSKKWEVLRTPLRCGAKGSKILVTTRSENVSRIMGTIHAYPLGILSDEDCWLLLGKRAFPAESWDEHPDLVVVGKKIAKKCSGIPLAAKTLGGVLQGTKQERKWKDILNSEIWKLPQGGEDDILNSLRLSYHHLPSHLKQCFLYCSIFPKDYEFKKEELVKLWMGGGFITSNVGQMEMEDVGCDYFDDLLWRSFFQCEKNEYVRLMYKMHDLIHDLAQSLSEGECFRMEDEKLIDFPEKARYASRITDTANDLTMFERLLKCKRLHTLRVFLRFETKSVPTNIFQQMKFLRVLELDGAMTELPDSIGNLKHLRYFALSSNYIERLPESVSILYNLQTLDLRDCYSLVELPKNTRNLINLRHLTFPTYYMSSTPKGIGRLTYLRTLSKFVVGKDSGHGIEQLMNLINLRGQLQISELQNVVNAEEVVWDNREYIEVEELDLSWEGYQSVSIAEEILERFQPHPNLRILKIKGYNGERFPSWIGDPSFCKLEEVVICDCKSCQTLPPLWQLPSLKKFCLHGGDFLVDGNLFNKAFPSLEELYIDLFPNLVEWSSSTEEKGDFPCLHTLRIVDCMSLIALPRFLTCVRELDLTNCNERILSSLSYFTSLSCLRIQRFKNLKGIPSGSLKNLKALKELSIYNCEELVTLDEGLQYLVSLQKLCISNLPQLASLPDEGLHYLVSLQELQIRNLPQLASLPNEGLQYLILLQELQIRNLPQLASLPDESLEYLVSLQELDIWNLPQLASLPDGLKNLISLKYLKIDDCKRLATLPKEGLPTTLQTLEIVRCPLLAEQCQKESGEYWPKISHIPNLRSDFWKFSSSIGASGSQ